MLSITASTDHARIWRYTPSFPQPNKKWPPIYVAGGNLTLYAIHCPLLKGEWLVTKMWCTAINLPYTKAQFLRELSRRGVPTLAYFAPSEKWKARNIAYLEFIASKIDWNNLTAKEVACLKAELAKTSGSMPLGQRVFLEELPKLGDLSRLEHLLYELGVDYPVNYEWQDKDGTRTLQEG